MNTKKIASITASVALLAVMNFVATPAFAENNTPKNQAPGQNGQGQGRMMGNRDEDNRGPGMMRQDVSGTVTAISGNTITISGHRAPTVGTTPAITTVTYTVDATNAVVRKNNATTTVSSILVGDKISVQGTVTGTKVVAKTIYDGVMGLGNRGEWNEGKGYKNGMGSTTPILGNGQPVIAGTVSAINGSILTLTTVSNVTYTVDATNAIILGDKNATVALSSIVIGNKVVVQGTVNGTSVTASTIIDQKIGATKPVSRGFFGSIGHFFTRIFGF